MALKTNSVKSTKIKFDNENSTKIKESIVSKAAPKKNKHIKFDNDDEENANNRSGGNITGGDGGKSKNHTEKKLPSKKSEKNRKNAMDIGKHWYQVVSIIILQ